jgi:hypothetical protein
LIKCVCASELDNDASERIRADIRVSGFGFLVDRSLVRKNCKEVETRMRTSSDLSARHLSSANCELRDGALALNTQRARATERLIRSIFVRFSMSDASASTGDTSLEHEKEESAQGGPVERQIGTKSLKNQKSLSLQPRAEPRKSSVSSCTLSPALKCCHGREDPKHTTLAKTFNDENFATSFRFVAFPPSSQLPPPCAAHCSG